MRVLGLVTMLFSGGLALAEDVALLKLRETLDGIRKIPISSRGWRGATPELTVAKHQLRDWVESKLTGFPVEGDEAEFSREVNLELKRAGLICGEQSAPECPSEGDVGFVGDLMLTRQNAFLVLKTSFNIVCGVDESAYLYSWSAEGWRRVWQTERTDQAKEQYDPQIITDVVLSPHNSENDYLALTLGYASWCSSTWRPVYYRAYRLGPDFDARPLLERTEMAWLNPEPPIRGSALEREIVVEFTIGSLDGGLHNRVAVRRFGFDQGMVVRKDPIALGPRDFVEEWLQADWRDAAQWTESEGRRASSHFHGSVHTGHISGEFVYPTNHCSGSPDLWQVGLKFDAPAEAKGRVAYFLVRWRPPYTFRLVQVGNGPLPSCQAKDPGADERRTLFTGWR